ncbi:MAG: EAL domain-containing protein [Motiliproteus sp.]|nr:EAL domain-containing protein [Motiliproteus sp.]
MKFSTRLIVLSLLSLGLAMTSWWILNWNESKQAQQLQRADAITRLLVELNAQHSLTIDYQEYGDQLTINQWLEKHRHIRPVLDNLPPLDNTQKTLVKSIISLNNSNYLLFKRLTATDGQTPLNQAARNELLNRLHDTHQATVEEGFRLSLYSQETTRKVTATSFWVVKLSLTTLAIVLTISAAFAAVVFGRRIQQLTSGIDKLREGNFDIKLEEQKDELGLLAGHFNRMAETLRGTTVQREELQQEVARQTLTLEQQKDRLKHQAEHDSLTHLPNRALFLESLQSAIARSKRSGYGVAMFFIDLDDFKQINDTLGHQVGDKVLMEVTERFKQVMRANDMIARLGGDEFTVIQEPLVNINDASTLAGKLIATLTEPLIYQRHQFFIHASIGISLFPENGEDAITLMRNADIAMYQAKNRGGNCFQYYNEEMTQAAMQRLEREADLRRGMRENELQIHFQPQLYLKSGTLAGAEALVRWQHPSEGLIPPDEFIPLAEETGLILELGEQVLRKACRQAQEWRQQGLNIGTLAVNLSGKQLHWEGLIGSVEQILNETGWPANQLELEVTEGYVMDEAKRSLHTLNQLRAMEVSLSIDDFGTGYSSLAYLNKLPVTKLKIDRSFVRDISHDLDDRAIITAIIALGDTLGLDVIAEGVETRGQADLLLERGCQQAQGYLFARPMCASEFSELVRSQIRQQQLKEV